MKISKVDRIKQIIEEKVKGVWIPEHSDKGHFYRHRDSGVLVSSVTTQIILDKPHLLGWAVEIGVREFITKLPTLDLKNEDQLQEAIENVKYAFRAVRDDAGNVGTRAHDVVERYINEWIETGIRRADIRTMIPVDELDGRVFAAVRSAEKFFNDHDGEIVPLACELLVGDEKTGVAGTLDLLVLWKGELWLLDHKTSNSATHDDYVIQVGTYKTLFQKMTGLRVKGASILGYSKGYDKYALLDTQNTHQAFQVFVGVSRAYKWLWNGKKKMIERKNRIKI